MTILDFLERGFGEFASDVAGGEFLGAGLGASGSVDGEGIENTGVDWDSAEWVREGSVERAYMGGGAEGYARADGGGSAPALASTPKPASVLARTSVPASTSAHTSALSTPPPAPQLALTPRVGKNAAAEAVSVAEAEVDVFALDADNQNDASDGALRLREILGGEFDLKRAVIEAEILTPKYLL